MEWQSREEQEKLALLRSLANEGFHDLDHGRAVAFEREEDLAAFIREIGRRAAAMRNGEDRRAEKT